MKLNLRKADKNDLEAIQALRLSLESSRMKQYDTSNSAFHTKRKPPASLQQADMKADVFIVAAVNKKIVGYVRGSLDKRPHHKLKKMGFIDELFIAENYRKKGIAKQLLAELEAFFLKKNCELVLTRTDWENKHAQELYSSFGMNKVTIEFWKEL